MIDREKLLQILKDYFEIGDSYTYELDVVKEAFGFRIIGLRDFHEWGDEEVENLCDFILEELDDD